MPRYDNIEFRWVNSEGEVLLAGQVLLRVGKRGPEMVLDIKGDGDGGPYLLVGKQPGRKSFFVAENSANGRVNDVRASWAEIGDGYAGRWIEDGYEYLFTFELPDKPRKR
jgi:hypothetical protein